MDIIIVPKDIQEIAEEYIHTHANLKELEKKVKSMRSIIEPYMKNNNLNEIPGIGNLGKIQIAEQDRPHITSRYTYYDASLIMPRLPMNLKKECIAHVIDKDRLEALVKLNAVPQDLLSYRIVNRVSMLRVMHTV